MYSKYRKPTKEGNSNVHARAGEFPHVKFHFQRAKCWGKTQLSKNSGATMEVHTLFYLIDSILLGLTQIINYIVSQSH